MQLLQLREHQQVNPSFAHQQETLDETYREEEKQLQVHERAGRVLVRRVRVQVSESAPIEGTLGAETRVGVQVRLRVLREEVQGEGRHEASRAVQAQGGADRVRRVREDVLEQQFPVRAPEVGAFQTKVRVRDMQEANGDPGEPRPTYFVATRETGELRVRGVWEVVH